MKIIYKCDYCNTIGTEDEIQAHEASCLHNPDNRCCLSCKYYVERGFKWEPQCACLQGYSFIICQGIAVPVVFDAVLYIRVKTLDAFHCTNLILLCKGKLFFAHSKMLCALFWVCVIFSCFCCWLLQITCWGKYGNKVSKS